MYSFFERRHSQVQEQLHRCILTLACFIILIPSVGFAQSDKIKPSMAALKALLLLRGLSHSPPHCIPHLGASLRRVSVML